MERAKCLPDYLTNPSTSRLASFSCFGKFVPFLRICGQNSLCESVVWLKRSVHKTVYCVERNRNIPTCRNKCFSRSIKVSCAVDNYFPFQVDIYENLLTDYTQ